MRMNLIDNFADFKEIMQGIDRVPLNIVYADVYGNYGYVLTGRGTFGIFLCN